MTFSTRQRRPLFVVESYVRLFLQTLYRYRREGRYELHVFVVMPEHVHLLLTPAQSVTLEHAIQLIKGGFSHALGAIVGRKREIWERGFTDHRIRNDQDFIHHQGYIHRNPVERKMVNDPALYRYCSAFPGFKLDSWPSAAKAEISKSAESARVELVPFPVLMPFLESRFPRRSYTNKDFLPSMVLPRRDLSVATEELVKHLTALHTVYIDQAPSRNAPLALSAHLPAK